MSRRRSVAAEPVDVLAEEDQEAIVSALETQVHSQSRMWRRCFTGFGAVLSLALVRPLTALASHLLSSPPSCGPFRGILCTLPHSLTHTPGKCCVLPLHTALASGLACRFLPHRAFAVRLAGGRCAAASLPLACALTRPTLAHSSGVSACAVACASLSLVASSARGLRSAFALSLVAALLWVWALWLLHTARQLSRARSGAEHDSLLVLVWLPLCSPAFVAMCGYVHSSALRMEEEVLLLKQQRYESKSA